MKEKLKHFILMTLAVIGAGIWMLISFLIWAVPIVLIAWIIKLLIFKH